MDKDTNHGGARQGAGRPSKSVEVDKIRKLSPCLPAAIRTLKKLIAQGDLKAVELLFQYVYSKQPTINSIDMTTKGEAISTTVVANITPETVKAILDELEDEL